MKIEYFEKKDNLWFSYCEEVDIPSKYHAKVTQTFETSGKIPKEVVGQGKKTIKVYAEKRVAENIAKQKKRAARQAEFEKNPNFSVSVKYDNRILKGKIISAEDTTLTVQLESPKKYKGQSHVTYGFASAMSGRYIFEKGTKFSQNAIRSAQNLLIDIYKKKKHEIENKKTIKLAKELNK